MATAPEADRLDVPAEEVQKHQVLTPNQVVAYNLARARKVRGWTQEEAADRLERHLGVRWSNVVFSAAERSAQMDRIRQFDADESSPWRRPSTSPSGGSSHLGPLTDFLDEHVDPDHQRTKTKETRADAKAFFSARVAFNRWRRFWPR